MDFDLVLIWVIALGLAALAIVPFLLRQRKLERQAAEAERVALQYGLHEPASLHPIVDPQLCIGTGNCVEVCPEKDVLGLQSGQARPISPARCIGHGLCERSCPMEAIQLVFGTEKRGVDIPRIKEDFETNVPGLYIIGELGGMGLIRNAFEQGRQCIEGIASKRRPSNGEEYDVVIVGCGPAGLSASLSCKHHGLQYITLEKENVGGTVRTYPRKKLVMTAPIDVPGYGRLKFREITKEELVSLWEEIIVSTGVQVQTGETVKSIDRTEDGKFVVWSEGNSYLARNVVVAIGRRGVPRKLGVPGEELPNVAYSLREPDDYHEDRILVVGGGDSAIEAALSLAEDRTNDVTVSYRGDAFSRLKPGNLDRIERAITTGIIHVLWSTNLTAIGPRSVHYVNETDVVHTLSTDYVFIFAGGELPTAFLKKCGIAIDTKFGTP